MDLSDFRRQIDEVDRQLLPLLEKRIMISESIGAYKREHGLPVYDPVREEKLIQKVRGGVQEAFADDAEELYRLLFTISKRHQHE